MNSTFTRRRFLFLGAGSMLASLSLPALAVNRSPEQLVWRKGQEVLALHFNENPLGMSPKAYQAAAAAIKSAGNRYADESIARLRADIAKRHNVSEGQVVLGNGSTQLIAASIAHARKRDARLLEPTPTYGDASRYARRAGMAVISVPVGQGFETDIGSLRAAAAKYKGPLIINICNPNNPTGTIVDQSALKDWIEQAPHDHVFIVDEAYHDFAMASPRYQSAVNFIHQGRENVVVLRTFSKVYGMAGMRVGYALTGVNSGKELSVFASDFNLNVAGVEAARQALKDKVFYQQSLDANAKGKQILLNALERLELAHIESHTNFVLHRINSHVVDYQRRMAANNIKVGRKMTQDDGWNRLSIGTPEEMQQFARVLHQFRERGWV